MLELSIYFLMKNLLILIVLIILASCTQKSPNQSIKSQDPQSASRVTSVHQPLTYTNNGVVITDEMDPALQFVYESKIAAPNSQQSIYGGVTQATGVGLIGNNKMLITYNTRMEAIAGGIDVVDISDLQSPVILYSYLIPDMEFSDVKISGTKAYLSGVSSNGALIATLDFTNFSLPFISDAKNISSFYSTSVDLKASSLIVATGDTGSVYSYNLDASGTPIEQSQEPLSNLLYVKHYAGGYLVLHDDSTGNTVFSYKDHNFNTLSSVALRSSRFESPARFDYFGGIAYISSADDQEIERVDLTNFTRMSPIPVTGRGNGLRYDSGMLYTAQGEEGFKLFDVRDTTPVYKGRFNFSDDSSANNIWTFNLATKKVVVLADGLGGVKILSQPLQNIPSHICTYASSVISYTPGGTVAANRKITSKALGAPEGDVNNLINFASLGKGGEIIVSFDAPIKNVSGKDLKMNEISWGTTFSNYPEQAEVYGSNDLLSWTYLGVVKNDNGNPSFGQIDLGSMSEAKYIKLKDITVFANSSDGYDIDGFSCINQENIPVCDSSINLINNGSFEMLAVEPGLVNGINLNEFSSPGAKWEIFEKVPFWMTESGSGIEIQTSGVSASAQEGNNLIELDSHANGVMGSDTNSKITQVKGLNPGNYKLSFYYQARTQDSSSELRVLINDAEVNLVSFSNSQWHFVEINVPVSNLGSVKIGFEGSGAQDSLGALLDNVKLMQVCQ